MLANVINNLPAVLVLLPLAAPAGPGAVLAVLLGVNIGPNLTYAGSLATLLWRRVCARARDRALTSENSPGSGCSPCLPGSVLGGACPVGRAAPDRRLITVTDPSSPGSSGGHLACLHGRRRAPTRPTTRAITLLHVTASEVPGAARGAYAGLLGRARPERDPGTRLEHLASASAGQLLDAAARSTRAPVRPAASASGQR